MNPKQKEDCVTHMMCWLLNAILAYIGWCRCEKGGPMEKEIAMKAAFSNSQPALITSKNY